MRLRERGKERKGTWPEGRGHKSGGVVVKEVVEARGGRKVWAALSPIPGVMECAWRESSQVAVRCW